MRAVRAPTGGAFRSTKYYQFDVNYSPRLTNSLHDHGAPRAAIARIDRSGDDRASHRSRLDGGDVVSLILASEIDRRKKEELAGDAEARRVLSGRGARRRTRAFPFPSNWRSGRSAPSAFQVFVVHDEINFVAVRKLLRINSSGLLSLEANWRKLDLPCNVFDIVVV